MTPWVTMPAGQEARRRAARRELELALSGIRCALALWHRVPEPRVRESVMRLVARELERAEEAVRRAGP